MNKWKLTHKAYEYLRKDLTDDIDISVTKLTLLNNTYDNISNFDLEDNAILFNIDSLNEQTMTFTINNKEAEQANFGKDSNFVALGLIATATSKIEDTTYDFLYAVLDLDEELNIPDKSTPFNKIINVTIVFDKVLNVINISSDIKSDLDIIKTRLEKVEKKTDSNVDIVDDIMNRLRMR